ncbi:MAG: cupin domain-containing protein [Cellvibrionales bacterium]|nr:cupin domain-containing protein [Cellvibrionales bacterium]
MSIANHPAAELLTDYAAGALRPAHALCIAAHLEHCAACRRQVRKLEMLGAHFFAGDGATGMRAEEGDRADADLERIRAAVLGRLEAEAARLAVSQCAASLGEEVKTQAGVRAVPAAQGQAHSPPNLRGREAVADKRADRGHSEMPGAGGKMRPYRVPRSLRQFIERGYDELRWQRLSPAIRVALLCRDKDGSQIALTRVKAGGKMPHHKHTGSEITVVLEGSFSDEDGIYHKGDILYRAAADRHRPVVTKDAECICLTVLDSPIQFTGFFARWLNPLLRRGYGAVG